MPHGKLDLRNRVSQNAIVQVTAKVLYMVSRLGLPPFILGYITVEQYGIWATCFIIVSYLGMSTFGIANVYIRYTAEYYAHQDTEAIARLLTTGLAITIPACILLLALLAGGMPLLLGLFRVAPHLRTTAAVLVFGTALAMMLDLTFGAFGYVLHGLQLMVRQTAIWVASFLVETALIIGLLFAGLGVFALLGAFIVRCVAASWLNAQACFRALPQLRLGVAHFDRKLVPLFCRYGGVVQLSGLLSTVLYSIEKVIAGAFLGTRATGLFDLGEKLPVMSSQVTSALNTVFLPAVTHLHSLGQMEEVARLYLKGARYISMLTGIVMGFLASFAAPIVFAWLGAKQAFQSVPLILACFTLAFQTHVTTGPCTAVHYGVKHPGRTLFYPLSQAALVAAFVGIAFRVWGLSIPAIAYGVASAMVISGWAYIRYSNTFLSIGTLRYFLQVILPGIVPYGFGWLLSVVAAPWLAAAGSERWQLAGRLAACGSLYVVVTAFFLYRVMCDWGEREYLRLQLRHSLAGLSGKALGTVTG